MPTGNPCSRRGPARPRAGSAQRFGSGKAAAREKLPGTCERHQRPSHPGATRDRRAAWRDRPSWLSEVGNVENIVLAGLVLGGTEVVMVLCVDNFDFGESRPALRSRCAFRFDVYDGIRLRSRRPRFWSLHRDVISSRSPLPHPGGSRSRCDAGDHVAAERSLVRSDVLSHDPRPGGTRIRPTRHVGIPVAASAFAAFPPREA